MMRLDDSREAGLLNPSTQYSSLETSMRMSEFDDMPMSRRPKSRSRCYGISVGIALIAVVVIVSVSVAGGKNNNAPDDDDSKTDNNMRKSPQRNAAPAPSPETLSIPAAGFASSPPAPTVETSEPISSPPLPSPLLSSPLLPTPQSVGTPLSAPLAPSPYSSGYDLVHYETICNNTIDPAVCLNLFASNPNSRKVDFQQWTIMTMEAAEQALNESYTLAVHLKQANSENVALRQCIDVFSEALALVNESMYTLADMDVHNPGTPAADVQEDLNAAMTNHDTCQDGIDDVGPFPGSDQLTGDQARHVDTLLSISLTFFNELIATSEDPASTSGDDPFHHRRLLHIASTAGRTVILGRRGLLSTSRDESQGLDRRLSPGIQTFL